MLTGLISGYQAAFAAVIDCKRTFSNHTEISFQPDLYATLPAHSYKADFTVTPYVVTVTHIHLPVCEEYADEYRITRPAGFDLLPGIIFATTDSISYNQSDSDAVSVIDLVAVEGLPDNHFEIRLDGNRNYRASNGRAQAATSDVTVQTW